MASKTPLIYHSQRRDRAGAQVGQVSDQPRTFTNRARATAGNASSQLWAGHATGAIGAGITIVVPHEADTGIHVRFGAGNATTDDLRLSPGFYHFATAQRIAMLRAGASDVTVYWTTSEVA